MVRISAVNGENSSSSSSSSTSLVLNNSDLLIKILLCLPVRSLLVLKPVSKHWCSLISDTYFMKNHYLLHDHSNKLPVSGLYFLHLTNKQEIPVYGMLLLDKAKLSSTEVSFVIQENERPVGLYIEQSCNGLFLCSRPAGYQTGTRYIYNPSTRHYRMIPQPPPFHEQDMEMRSYCYWKFYLAFSPSKSLSYEIVFLWRTGYENDCDHQMAVYSSKTGSWGLCEYVDLDYRLLSHHCVFWNGCLNCIDNHTLYYFNISQQLLNKSRVSDEMQEYWHEPEYFEECMGHMYLILRDDASWLTCNFFSVFEMEIDYSGWKPICRVDLDELANKYGMGRDPYLSYSILKVVVVEGDGDEDELKALIHLPGYGKFVSYDLKVKSFNEICDSQMGWKVESPQPAYIGSLANV